MTEPRVWHQSSLASLLRCGVQYQRRYLERESSGTPSTTAQIRGSAVHYAIGVGLGIQQRGGALAPADLYEDVAASQIARARHGGATLTAEEASRGIATTWALLTDAAVAYAGTYGRDVAPTIRPLAVERRITVADVPGLPGIQLRGTLDLVTEESNGATTHEMVRDEKTTERAPRGNQADTSGQLTMYSLLRSSEAGKLISHVALDHLVRDAATGAVRHVHQTSTRSSADLHALVRRIAAADAAVQAGVFLPASPEDWWCSERWCSFWATCPFAQGRR